MRCLLREDEGRGNSRLGQLGVCSPFSKPCPPAPLDNVPLDKHTEDNKDSF